MVNSLEDLDFEENQTDNEECYILLGWQQGDFIYCSFDQRSEGKPCEVEFDVDYVLEQKDFVGTYHTHPHMPAFPSTTDINTMQGWAVSEGKPILCLIEGIDGLRVYLFTKDLLLKSFEDNSLPFIELFQFIRWEGKFAVKIT